jgi:hypothetical protein
MHHLQPACFHCNTGHLRLLDWVVALVVGGEFLQFDCQCHCYVHQLPSCDQVLPYHYDKTSLLAGVWYVDCAQVSLFHTVYKAAQKWGHTGIDPAVWFRIHIPD